MFQVNYKITYIFYRGDVAFIGFGAKEGLKNNAQTIVIGVEPTVVVAAELYIEIVL